MIHFHLHPQIFSHNVPISAPLPTLVLVFVVLFSHLCVALTGATDMLEFVTTLLNQNKSLLTFRDPLH